jgi:dihydrofolate synthase / folylpolyglutamate synthase
VRVKQQIPCGNDKPKDNNKDRRGSGQESKDEMTYEQAMERLTALGPEMRTVRVGGQLVARKFSLDHIKALLQELGDPQKTFKSVLIAGTNGKGSTAATLASIATAAGVKTGLFTSPHLERVNERLRVSSGGALKEISDAEFGACFGRVDAAALALVERGVLPHEPSYFEFMTALAFCRFVEAGVELAVLEVGLGGRLDATNSVEPVVSVITDIGMDHMEYLGHTLREIAMEKAGILRENGVLVTLSQHPEANAAIGDVAMKLNVRGVDAVRCLATRDEMRDARDMDGRVRLARNRYSLSVEGKVIEVDSPLAGQHQQRNIALAIATAIELRTNHGVAIDNAAIESGVKATVWPGRLEWIVLGDGAPVLMDVAHNPAGAWTLRAALAQLPDAMPRTLIFSCLKDKQLKELAQVLFPLFDATSGDPERARDHVVLAPIDTPRTMPLGELMAAAQAMDVPATGAATLAEALRIAREVTPKDGVIVATGSVFLVGELRAALRGAGSLRG